MPGPPISNLTANIFTIDGALLWFALAALAIVVDFAAGPFVARYVPSLATIFKSFARKAIKKLDRPSRTLSALRMRGFITMIITLPAAFCLGLLFNFLMVQTPYAPVVALGLLVPLLGQKNSRQRIIETGKQLGARESSHNSDPHQPVRAAAAKAILDFAVKLVPRTLWWCLGGFALLLPHILLGAFIDEAEKRRSGHPESAFFSTMSFAYELTTALPAIGAAILLALAHFFLPNTNLSVFNALNPRPLFRTGATYGPVSRYFPLNVVAVGLGLSMEAEIGEKASSKKISDKAIHWIGLEDGRAQFLATDLKRVWLVTLIGFALYILVSAMIFAFLLLYGKAE